MNKITLTAMHDVLTEAFEGVTFNESQIKLWYDKIPSDIKNLIGLWGINDTEVRDNLYTWVLDNKDIFLMGTESDFLGDNHFKGKHFFILCETSEDKISKFEYIERGLPANGFQTWVRNSYKEICDKNMSVAILDVKII
jgi:hypothetical protein